MSKVEHFDVVVIGAGSAGFSAAERAHSLGANVCIIEKDAWGGECPNFACVPTKALLKSAKLYYNARKMDAYGVHATEVTYNFARIMKRKDEVVNTITGEGKRLLKVAKKMGMKTIQGTAVFLDKHTVEVNGKKVRGKKFVIATGTTDFVPPIDGIDDADYLLYREVMKLKKRPDSLVIVGGGPVGCEFATFFSMLGAKVTLLQLAPVVLNREDAEVSALAQKLLQEYGVNVMTNTKALSVEKSGGALKVTVQQGRKTRQVISVEKILLAAGKRANVDMLELEKAGVKLDDRGRLVVSEALQTSQKHIFAAGDVSGGMLFTHTAHDEGFIAGENVMKDSRKGMLKRDHRVIPRVTFLQPEIASVGVTPEEAIDQKKKIVIAKFPVGALGRAVTEGAREGLVKIVVDEKNRQILGGHIVSEHAGEMIHEIALAMHKKMTIDDVAKLIHAFPTYSEAIVAAAASV